MTDIHKKPKEADIKAYVLFSSSRGNCTYIKHNNTEILIDAGHNAKRISESLSKLGTSLSGISAIFITHEHIDHVGALNVICRHNSVPVYVPEKSLDYISKNMPWTSDHLIENGEGNTIAIGGLKITAFETPHDSLGSLCFRIETETTRLGYATDIGYVSGNVKAALYGCENVVLESNYDPDMLRNGPYPYSTQQRIAGKKGHLSNGECAAFILELYKYGTRNIVLAHLSQNNNKSHVAMGECRGALNGAGIPVYSDFSSDGIRLVPASPDNIVEII